MNAFGTSLQLIRNLLNKKTSTPSMHK